MALTHEQVDALLQPLHPSRVRSVQGNAHLEAWDVRRHLLRVFGWGGWDFHVIACDLVSERSKWDEQNPLKGRHTVVYRCLGRLTIKDREGNTLAAFEDGATGDAANQPSLGDAHDMAMKTAMSQALKRCAMNLGDRFGLGLYNGGKTDPVVGKSLAHTSTEVAASEHVEDGEMSEPQPEVERQGRKKKSDPTPPPVDEWSTSDPKWLAEWREQLQCATTRDLLAESWANLGAAIASGQVVQADVAAVEGEWIARRGVVFPPEVDGQLDMATGEVEWPEVATPPDAEAVAS